MTLSERLRDRLQSFTRYGVIGLLGMTVVLLVWRVLRNGQAFLVSFLPPDSSLLPDSAEQTLVGAVLLSVLLVLFGRLLDRIFGQRLVAIPVVGRFARSSQRIVTELDPSETHGLPVVLVQITPTQLKQMAILTSVMTDEASGQKIAAIYVPGTPNVNVGETRLVPLEKVTMTTWTVKDALAFLMSGGSVAPSGIHHDESASE